MTDLCQLNSDAATQSGNAQASYGAPPLFMQTEIMSFNPVMSSTSHFEFKNSHRPDPQDGFTVPMDRDALFEELSQLVRGLVRQYGTDPETRQDLIGEIYYRFCVLLDSYDPERGVPLRGYLVRQLSASIYTYARQQWRLRSRETHLEMEEGTKEMLPSHDPTEQWNQSVFHQQMRGVMMEAIEALPQRQREVVIGRYFNSFTFEEIASHLDIQVASARSLLRHGLNSLRQKMSDPSLEKV